MKITKSVALKLYTENQLWKTQITDLKINLKLNKDILSTYSSASKPSTDNSSSLWEFQKIMSEKSNLEKAYNDLLDKYTNELISATSNIEKIKKENFKLQNTIIEKDNIIKSLRSSSRTDAGESNIIITSPNKAMLELNEELLKYKFLYSLNQKHNYNNNIYNTINDSHMTTVQILNDSKFNISFDSFKNCDDWNKRFDSLESSWNSSNIEEGNVPIHYNLTLPEHINKEGKPKEKEKEKIRHLKEINSSLQEQLTKALKKVEFFKNKCGNKSNVDQSMDASVNFGSIIDRWKHEYESYNTSTNTGNNDALNKTIISWIS